MHNQTKNMKYPSFIFLLLLIISCNDKDPDPKPTADTFIRGADLSFLPEIESHNPEFFDASGNMKDVLTILKEAGCNTVRVRLWHTPQNNHSGLEEVADFSSRVKAAHDPGHFPEYGKYVAS